MAGKHRTCATGPRQYRGAYGLHSHPFSSLGRWAMDCMVENGTLTARGAFLRTKRLPNMVWQSFAQARKYRCAQIANAIPSTRRPLAKGHYLASLALWV